MNITNKTVLITGGGSGIGFAIAETLSKKNNKVIITGRSEARLKDAVGKLNNVSGFSTQFIHKCLSGIIYQYIQIRMFFCQVAYQPVNIFFLGNIGYKIAYVI